MPFPGATGLVTGAEAILVIPEFPCTYCTDRAFFQASAVNDQINSYPLSDFTGFGGDILIPTEAGAPGTLRVHFDVPSNSYQGFVFDASASLNEGATFVDGSCPPSPTPTPTATFTPTATATATLRQQLQLQLRQRLLQPLRLQLLLQQRLRLLLPQRLRLLLQRQLRRLPLPLPHPRRHQWDT